jgi:hypothetical protein
VAWFTTRRRPCPSPVRQLYEQLHGLFDGQIKANFNIKPDGVVQVIAAGAATFASGKGSSVVLNETRSSVAPSDTAAARGLVDDRTGNPHYVNCEADHAGDGSAMPAAQERAIVKAYGALFRNLGWPSARLIGHCEWTRRKIDPRWSGQGNRAPTLRNLLAAERAAPAARHRG